MLLIAFGVVVCAYGELNLVIKGLVQQLLALCFEVGKSVRGWVASVLAGPPTLCLLGFCSPFYTPEVSPCPAACIPPCLSRRKAVGLSACAACGGICECILLHFAVPHLVVSFCAALCDGAQALRLTLVQVLINAKGLNMNPMQSLYYVSPACLAGLLIPFCECALPV